jgi:hypothetical protein
MCSTYKQWKLTSKPVVSNQTFGAIKFPLLVGAHKKFGIDRSKAQRKTEHRTRPNFPRFTYI